MQQKSGCRIEIPGDYMKHKDKTQRQTQKEVDEAEIESAASTMPM